MDILRHLGENRARKLRITAVPLPFTVAYRTLTSHSAAVERRAHELLAFHRVDPRREYFTVTPAQAVAAIQRASIQAGGIEAWDTAPSTPCHPLIVQAMSRNCRSSAGNA
ncbi:GIY-YIG nuclease family protein [Actinokineospora bangkokensis]|uniref:GIY-YIG nuclease family protein n=1 Tax=Actinokineospora bangkokensis TaxID=1193682 RepID=UPI0009FDCEE0